MSCQTLTSQGNGEIQPLKLTEGWTPTYETTLNGKLFKMKCLSLEDKDKLTDYLNLLEANAGVKYK